jgi:hypothetical protein
MSMTSPKRALCANARPFSASGLHLGKGIPYCQKVRNQLVAAVSSKCKIADPVGSIEGAMYQIVTLQSMFSPWHDDVSERYIGSSLITR